MDKGGKKSFFKADALFAASNSANGFKSYYSEIFYKKKFERIYIIKGGPGTGKSRFMKEVASFSQQMGYCVEYYNCSSDPDSLDAVIINEKIVLLDGTAPHVFEPEIVGARDEIINLGSFWNSEKLFEKRTEIEELCDKKNRSYIRGYAYLSGCGEIFGINRSLMLGAVKEDKLISSVKRIISMYPSGDAASVTPALIDSVGMKGRVRFDTYEKCAEKLYIVLDWYSTAYLYISAIITHAQRANIPMKVSYDPINSDIPNAVYFCNSGVAFVATEPSEAVKDEGIIINMKRFLDKDAVDEVKQKYRYNMRLYEALLGSACESFSEAGEYHFALEKIYLACMDFDAKERYTKSFCEQIKTVLS